MSKENNKKGFRDKLNNAKYEVGSRALEAETGIPSKVSKPLIKKADKKVRILQVIAICIVLMFVILFATALAIVFEDDESAMVQISQREIADEWEPELEGTQLEGIELGDQAYMQAQMIYKALEEDPSLIDKLSFQLPAGVVNVLPSNLTAKNLLEVYIIFNEVMNNVNVADNAKFSLDILFGTFAMESNFGDKYYSTDGELNFFTAINYNEESGDFKGPFQMHPDYFTGDYHYYISKYEDPDLEDSQRLGRYDSGVGNNLKLEVSRRTNRGTRCYFFPDMVAWVVSDWSSYIAGKQDTPDKVINGYGLVDDKQKQIIYDFLVDAKHRGAGFDAITLQADTLNGNGKLVNPTLNYGTALAVAAAKDNLVDQIIGYDIGNGRYAVGGLNSGSKGNFTGTPLAQVAQSTDSCGFGNSWQNLNYGKEWSEKNPELHLSALIRITKGRQCVVQAQTLIDAWFNELGLSLGSMVVPGTFDETYGVAQGIYMYNNSQMTLEQILDTKGLLNNAQIRALREDFGTAGHHTCGRIESASGTASWQASSKWNVPFYHQVSPSKHKCDCMYFRDDNVGSRITIGRNGCHLYMSAYIASAFTGRLINPAEIAAIFLAEGGVDARGYYKWDGARAVFNDLGISSTWFRSSFKANWWEIVDNTLAMNGLVGAWMGDAVGGITTNSEHYIVITEKLPNGNYRIYSSSSLADSKKEWTRAELQASWEAKGSSAGLVPAVKGNYSLQGTKWIPN